MYTQLIVNNLCCAQNYSFFVVSYSNIEQTLPSQWSDVVMLIPGNLYFILFKYCIISFSMYVNDVTQSSSN